MNTGPGTKKNPGPDLSLTPDQHDLLMTALSSNRSPAMPNSNPNSSAQNLTRPATARADGTPKQGRRSLEAAMTGTDLFKSPMQESPKSGAIGSESFEDSPFLDYELEDGSFDWDNTGDLMIGSLPGATHEEEGDLHDKRKSPEDEEDEEEPGHKRREGEDKTAKKPGRKPLTGEPTTKRKAQNRAAQRAFRERKERHLKELETKVDELERASESTNHENGKLRAQVDRLNIELKEYKKRVLLNGTPTGRSPPLATALQARKSWNHNQNDFQFAFPKFGDLPGSNFMNNGSLTKVGSPNRVDQRSQPQGSLAVIKANSSGSLGGNSPSNVHDSSKVVSSDYGAIQASANGVGMYEDLNGLFSPSILETASRSSSDYMSYSTEVRTAPYTDKQGNVNRGSSISNVTSPTNSLMSNNGLDSSCGTTPEPSLDSPDSRKASETTLNTINEETQGQKNLDAPSSITKSPMNDINGIDWMAQQNGGQFDPVLFGEYRDPQDSILNSNFGGFFNDAFVPPDFGSPFPTGEVAASPAPKRDLLKEIETQQNDNDNVVPIPTQSVAGAQRISCNQKLWDRVQESDRLQSGEYDMDSLCAQLKAKAKCNGTEATIDPKDIDDILGSASEAGPAGQKDFMKMFS